MSILVIFAVLFLVAWPVPVSRKRLAETTCHHLFGYCYAYTIYPVAKCTTREMFVINQIKNVKNKSTKDARNDKW